MQDFADLTSTLRKTRGEVPPPLVGSSVTLVGEGIFVFGGRPVDSRGMISSLYRLDLRTLVWTKIEPSPCDPSPSSSSAPPLLSSSSNTLFAPTPRYFHSAEAWGDKLVIFGGQSYVLDEGETTISQDGGGGANGHLETLDELWIFDTLEQTWTTPVTTVKSGSTHPIPRYAHLSVVSTVTSEVPVPGFEDSAPPPSTSSRLIIIGGQDYQNNYISEMSVLDLDKMEWIAQAPYPRKAGSYRSVASTSQTSLAPLEVRPGSDGHTVYSSHSLRSQEDNPEPIFVFTNSNFASPRRDLDLIPAPLDAFTTPSYLSIADRMVADSALPPGVRFPRLYSCGSRNLILSGAHVGINRAEFVIYALDLGERGGSGALRCNERMPWQPISVEKILGNGSWGPSVGWKNTLVVLGDKDRDQMADYNSRQTNFTQVVFVDLESFGIYEPPPQPLPPTAQTLGLLSLSQPRLFDFEIICNDRERLGCCRAILESRWPWFASELEAITSKASASVEAKETLTTGDDFDLEDTSDEEPMDVLQRTQSPVPQSRPSTSLARPLPSSAKNPTRRLFPISAYALELPLSSPEVKALLQYFHTLSLSTPLQRSIPILTSLLNFDKTYNILPNLRALIVHALHESLSSDPASAAKIYEAAALGRSMALQIAAMQAMLSQGPENDSTSNRSRENSFVDVADRMQRFSDGSYLSSSGSRYSGRSEEFNSSHPPSAAQSIRTPPSHTVSPLSPPPTMSLPPPPPSTSSTPSPLSAPVRSSPFPPRSASRATSIDANSIMSGLPGAPSMNFPIPPTRPDVSPTPSIAENPPSSTTKLSTPATSAPARIADAWREGEERDRRQRAEQARLEAEAGFGRMRLGQRNGSIATVSTQSSRGSISDQHRRPSTTPSTVPSGTAFSLSPTESVANFYRDSDTSSLRTTSSGGDSGHTQTSSEKARKSTATAAKVIKKGLWAGLLAQPEFHQTAAAPVATGPPARKVYPAPRPKYPTKGKKGTSDSASATSK